MLLCALATLRRPDGPSGDRNTRTVRHVVLLILLLGSLLPEAVAENIRDGVIAIYAMGVTSCAGKLYTFAYFISCPAVIDIVKTTSSQLCFIPLLLSRNVLGTQYFQR